jgi:Malate/lactate dehydrogenases
MDVAVIGATGAVGREVCIQLIERQVLPPSSRLQLVGRAGGSSGPAVHGFRADLLDAYDEFAPMIDVALDPSEVVADVIVFAAGATAPPRPGASADRDALAATNAAVFESYARSFAQYGSGREVVIMVTNPVELGVAMLSRVLDRHQVIGMGAWLDTLRLRREIATSLGMRRHRISGFAAGQHGNGVVPLWSSVRVAGLDVDERRRAVRRIRGQRDLGSFGEEVAAAQARLRDVAGGDVGAAFELVETMPPDVRMVVGAWMTHQSGARTAVGTANATVELVETLMDGREIVVAGQVALDGEISLGGEPVGGVLGVPVVLGPEGWSRALLADLAPDEEELLMSTSAHIRALCSTYLGEVDRG